jgi:hypothetical protein
MRASRSEFERRMRGGEDEANGAGRRTFRRGNTKVLQ